MMDYIDKYISVLAAGNKPIATVSSLKERHEKKTPFALASGVYGLIRMVTADKVTPFCASSKIVTICDPTDTLGLHIEIRGKTELLLPGNIIKITSLKDKNDQTNIYYSAEATNVYQFMTFDYDYESSTNHQESTYASQPFEGDKMADEPICRVLEEWLTDSLLNNSFSELAPITSRNYIDFVAQILEQRHMFGSMVLTVWDGTKPGTSTDDPYKDSYAATYTSYGNNYSMRRNPVYDHVTMDKHVYVNVWKNQSNSSNNHFEKCSNFQLKDGDDVIVMFNVEIGPSKLGPEYPIQVNMRSGHHQGKAVRLVKPHSILGRKFREIIDNQLNLDQDKEEDDLDHDGSIFEMDQQVEEAAVGDNENPFATLATPRRGDFSDLPSRITSTPTGGNTPKEPEQKKRKVTKADSATKSGSSTMPQTTTATTTSSSSVIRTQIDIDVNDPGIKSLLENLPNHISFNALVEMDEDELDLYESIVQDLDNVDAIVKEIGPQMTKDMLLEVLKLARAVKNCSKSAPK